MLESAEPARARPLKWIIMLAAAAIAAVALLLTLFHEAGGMQSQQGLQASTSPASTTLQLPAPAELPATPEQGPDPTASVIRTSLPLPAPARTTGISDLDPEANTPVKRAMLPLAARTAAVSDQAPETKSPLMRSTLPEPSPAPAPAETAAIQKSQADAAVISKSLPLPLPAITSKTPAQAASVQSASSVIDFEIARGDTLDELFADNDLNRGHLAQILRLDGARNHLQLLRPGDRLSVEHDQGNLIRLSRALDEERTLNVFRENGDFRLDIAINPVEIRTAHAHGQIDSSLFLAAQKIGISDTLIMNLAGIFAWDIDFILDIRAGDSFTLLYQERWQDGEKLSDGEILAAEFVNNGNTFRAVRFVDPNGESGYFTPDGHNVRKAFLRAPIAITPRVTSSFNPRRLHPVKKKVLPHKGVDYSAPTGTPIKAAGDGKVIFRGRKGGYGNTVIIQHGGNITTLYAHLSRFNKRTRLSSRVKQGQIIGYSGATGTVTAAHLHYEYRVNGVHRNPRTVKLPKAQPVASQFRDQFAAMTSPLIRQLEVVERTLRLASHGEQHE